jgi:hypothetical protein
MANQKKITVKNVLEVCQEAIKKYDEMGSYTDSMLWSYVIPLLKKRAILDHKKKYNCYKKNTLPNPKQIIEKPEVDLSNPIKRVR